MSVVMSFIKTMGQQILRKKKDSVWVEYKFSNNLPNLKFVGF